MERDAETKYKEGVAFASVEWNLLNKLFGYFALQTVYSAIESTKIFFFLVFQLFTYPNLLGLNYGTVF